MTTESAAVRSFSFATWPVTPVAPVEQEAVFDNGHWNAVRARYPWLRWAHPEHEYIWSDAIGADGG